MRKGKRGNKLPSQKAKIEETIYDFFNAQGDEEFYIEEADFALNAAQLAEKILALTSEVESDTETSLRRHNARYRWILSMISEALTSGFLYCPCCGQWTASKSHGEDRLCVGPNHENCEDPSPTYCYHEKTEQESLQRILKFVNEGLTS